MKLILIYPDILKGAGWTGYFYTGVGYLTTAARQAGHQVEFLHVTKLPHPGEFLEMFEERLGDDREALIGFSATSNMFGFVREMTGWIRGRHKNPIVVGGVHPTLNPQETLDADDGINAICIGEGEEPLVELLDTLERGADISGIGNLWVRRNGQVHRNEVRPVPKDLDRLGFPERSIFDYAQLDCERNGIGVFMASRGCPYNCYYCCNHAIRQCLGDPKAYVRFRTVDHVIREIQQVVREYPFIKRLHFDDDILPMKKSWFEEFSRRYQQEVALPFECNVRPNLIDERTVELMRTAGCQTLRLGLESGNAYIRNEILNRGLSQETIVRAAQLCRQAGMRVYTFNMVGLPCEDMAARLDTVKLNAQIQADEEQVSIFYPYERTRLFDICTEQGLTRRKHVTDPFRDTSLSFGMLQRHQIVFTAYYFPILVRLYRAYGRLPGVLSRLTARTSDLVLANRLTAATVYPVLIGLLRFISRHQRLENWARKIKRRFYHKRTS